jgi:predicted RNA binding protein YcfA (HicA-like mRNA interferase family)
MSWADEKKSLIRRARSNPNSLKFREFEKLLKQEKWVLQRQRGDHRLWVSPQGHRLPIQPKGNDAKGYQVRQFLAQYDREHPDAETET